MTYKEYVERYEFIVNSFTYTATMDLKDYYLKDLEILMENHKDGDFEEIEACNKAYEYVSKKYKSTK